MFHNVLKLSKKNGWSITIMANSVMSPFKVFDMLCACEGEDVHEM